MRFGGYDEALFEKGHKQIWLNTTGSMSWEVKFSHAGFHEDKIWENVHALIDPGFPFIAMPWTHWLLFKEDLLNQYKVATEYKNWS